MEQTYYIYHIPGVKIGCTVDVHLRMKQQGCTNYEILEEHTDIYIASRREIELQKEYNYNVDNIPYFQTMLNCNSEEAKLKRSITHTGMKRSNKACQNMSEVRKGIQFSEETIKKMSEARKGISPVNKGTKMPDEQRTKLSEIKKGTKLSNLHKDAIKKAWEKKPKIKCPHCGLESRGPSMKRYHFNNCKQK